MCFQITYLFFFFNDTATTEIYTLSLHDALPILSPPALTTFAPVMRALIVEGCGEEGGRARPGSDRKSTRLNSSHGYISYAVFCLKKKNNSSIARDVCCINSIASMACIRHRESCH